MSSLAPHGGEVLGATPGHPLLIPALSRSLALSMSRQVKLLIDSGIRFSPARLFSNGEQGAWYDPSDLTTLFQDSAGTTPVTADGQTVGKVLDKSGRGNHATAPSDAARPLYKTDGTYHWLQFDGVDDALVTAAIDFTATDKMTVWAGMRKIAEMGLLDVALECGDMFGSTTGAFSLLAKANGSPGNAAFGSRGTADKYAIKAFPVGSTAVLTGISSINPPSIILRVNAVSGTENTASQGGGTYPNSIMAIGRRMGLYYYMNCNLHSLIVRGALSTTQEIIDTETWVNGKTGAF